MINYQKIVKFSTGDKKMNISLPFITAPAHPRKKSKLISKKRTIIKIKNEYAPIEIQNMDDAHLEYIYEHGSPAERDVAEEIIKNRQRWDTIINKGLDDTLPTGSGQTGAPEAGGG
jgi:hypothetical protein